MRRLHHTARRHEQRHDIDRVHIEQVLDVAVEIVVRRDPHVAVCIDGERMATLLQPRDELVDGQPGPPRRSANSQPVRAAAC